MILVGVNEPNAIDSKTIDFLANDASVSVWTETTSNLHHSSFIANIDTIITPFTTSDFENFQPEILVTFGGMVVSKRIKAFLRKYKPKHHWHIDSLRAYDTFGALTQHFEMDPQLFFDRFIPLTKVVESDYSQQLIEIKSTRKLKHDVYLASVPFSDFTVFEKIPEGAMQ
jgi:2-succinyl-5-enolpyruvyl-6-hydroxy-3-cyclohexene-1-carboxylate synthase